MSVSQHPIIWKVPCGSSLMLILPSICFPGFLFLKGAGEAWALKSRQGVKGVKDPGLSPGAMHGPERVMSPLFMSGFSSIK